MVAGRVLRASVVLLLSGCSGETKAAVDPGTLPWDAVEAHARGTSVTWRMWRGDPSINAYVDRWVAPRLRQRYGITLHTVEGQGPEIVNQLLLEKQAGAMGSADLVWINGEAFHNLREADLLYGPWAHRLPNAAFVDSASSTIQRDFEQPTDGYESPWGAVQFALIYDSARTPHPPGTIAELAAWIRRHPGRFTHDQGFTGTTFLKVLLYALNGGVATFQGGFEPERYHRGSERVWTWLDSLRPAFWRGGAAYPPGVAELHRLFANGEVDFSMSMNQNEVVTKVRQGVLPRTARPLLIRDGTIANTHYLGVPGNAANPAGALVVANFLLSPEAQLEKLKPEVWADGSVLATPRLPPAWAGQFRALEAASHALPLDSLTKYARPEVAPEYHERLAADWRARIRAGGS